MTAPTNPTDAEIRLVEQYVRVLDFISRCAQAIDHGDWFYLHDKAAQLEDVAGGLSRVAGETWEQVTGPAGCCTPPTPSPPRQGVGGHDRHASKGLLG